MYVYIYIYALIPFNIPWYPRFSPRSPIPQVVYLKETYVPDEFADLLEARLFDFKIK